MAGINNLPKKGIRMPDTTIQETSNKLTGQKQTDNGMHISYFIEHHPVEFSAETILKY